MARASTVRRAGASAGASAVAREMARFRARVYRLVALIPRGRVATYGQISVLAGHPRRARHVGNALHGSSGHAIPWHRVLNAQGKVSARSGETRPRGDERIERRQQRLLEAEGVHFVRGRVDLARYRWRPEEHGAPLARKPRRVK
jgi:methylated-DNA-protein-cysteine methyltransferase related protein